jgi:hypothetical protein
LRFVKFMEPYLYFFELTNGYSFFSPNPEPPIYIEYELLAPNGDSLRRARWPEAKDPFFLRERQNRRISATDYMMVSDIRTEKMMVPYLCQKEPLVHSVKLWRVMYSFSTPQEVAEGKRTIGDDVNSVRQYVSHTFCSSLGSGLAEASFR